MRNIENHSRGNRQERRHRRSRGGGRGRLGRFFAHGDLRYLVLWLLSDQPRHGYEVIKEIEERVAGAYSPSPGVIYPTLTLLEELGWARVQPGEGTRKCYEITDEGSLALEANKTSVDAIFQRMEEARDRAGRRRGSRGAPVDGDFAPAIRQALDDLDETLKARAGDASLAADQVRAIADALTGAASAIRNI